MLELSKTSTKFGSIIFGAIVLIFTGIQTWDLLYTVSGSALVATAGLAIFEGGMLYWLVTFLVSAEGLPQMALSLLAATFSLFLVGAAVGMHLGAIDATQLGANTPARLIAIAAFVNLVAKFLYPIFNPKQMQKIIKDASKGAIMATAFAAFKTHTDGIAQELSSEMVAVWAGEMRTDLFTANHISLPTGAVASLPVANGDETTEREPVMIVDADGRQDSAETKAPMGFTIRGENFDSDTIAKILVNGVTNETEKQQVTDFLAWMTRD